MGSRGPIKKTRERSCDGKRGHETRHEADHAAAMLRRRGDVVKSYHCPFCGLFHVGHRRRAGVRGQKA